MPIISGGGGGGAPTGAAGGDLGGTYPNPTVDLMSGGTVTGKLTVDPSTAVACLDLESGFSASDADTILVAKNSAGATVAEITSDGNLAVTGRDAGTTPLTVSSAVALGAGKYLLSGGGSVGNGGVLSTGHLGMVGVTVVPVDGALAAGDIAFWLDASNGASKFMIKAKSADGTVVTAAVALA